MKKRVKIGKRTFYYVRESDPMDDIGNRTFWDALGDVFTHPADLKLHQPVECGFMGRVRDGLHIREYFRKAIERLGLEESGSVSRAEMTSTDKAQAESDSDEPIRHISELSEEEKLAFLRQVSQDFEEPLPPPDDFEKYETVLPGAADRIMTMAENEQKIRADAQAGRLAHDRIKINEAILLGMCLIVLAGLATWFGYTGTALSLGLAGFVVALFLQGLDWYRPRRNGG